MSDRPAKSGRKQDTRFKPGKSGNPAGKRPGTRHKVTQAVEALLEGEHEALTRKAIEKAMEGDTVALRLCLDRIAPPRKDAPVSFDLPAIRTAGDTVTASSALLEAVAVGEVTPDEAGRLMALLTAHKALVETGDLEARITALEAKR
ncbi:hypothetical protein GCM10011371_21770 [Novosphingobium marinum]|uniref:DUF5681 domain-containing protein n=1 Tax=Novosphingobium marinum TaxID=1514948 RepID=A0A7Z0BTR2_9SPHN|nr:DUF5681 domain-containing protein [Novosphingobium marinum]NYH96291.1 hypothetical protein [Novosphingobium marinum]GGC34037.1 hypothetical protein GCM10011371_21770 [Novosphingobium marinum]